MRTRIWLFGASVLLICILILLRRTSHHKDMGLTGEKTQPTNQPSSPNQAGQPRPINPINDRQASNVLRMLALPPSVSPLVEALATTNPVAAKRVALWQTPIEFYGKVVDENTNPVAGATISFSWVEFPAEDGNRRTNTLSDAEGLFSLGGERGPNLSILVSKEGYYPRRGGARYGPAATPEFSPDPANPVVFGLHKKRQGVELITSENGVRLKVDVRLPRDGTPVRVNMLEKKANASGQLEISQNKPPWREATQWSFRMSLPDGGFVENEDEFQFEAPGKNYMPTVEYQFNKTETNWTTQVSKQFYITFGKPRKFGWLRIECNLTQETIFLTYAINPDGSRNLEPKQ